MCGDLIVRGGGMDRGMGFYGFSFTASLYIVG